MSLAIPNIPPLYYILAVIAGISITIAIYHDFITSLIKRIILAAIVYAIILAGLFLLTNIRLGFGDALVGFGAEELLFIVVFVVQRRLAN